jgi:dihydroorotase
MTKTLPGKPLYITNAELLDAKNKVKGQGEILLVEGKIAALGKPGELRAKAKAAKANTLDTKGLLLVPGFIDLQCYIYEPGNEHVESFTSASLAAAAGGFTSLCVKPDTTPVNDNAFMTDFLLRRAREHSSVRILPIGALTVAKEGKRLAEMGSMAAAGIVAVSDGIGITDSYLMRKALEYSKAFQLPVFVHAEDRLLSGLGVMHEGINSNRLGLRGIPSAAEDIAVARELVLAKHTGGKIHFHSLSTRGALEMARQAKSAGLEFSVETNPQYFTLNCEAINSYDANYKCFPPLRDLADVEAVIEALVDGTIDAIATNHLPQSKASKEQAFEFASPGMVGLETALPLGLRLVKQKKLKLERLIALLTTGPAKILGLEKTHGALKVGAYADLTLIDLKKRYVFQENTMHGAAKNTPFLNENFEGRVECTIANGSVIFQQGEK